jgi:hypothetical protein
MSKLSSCRVGKGGPSFRFAHDARPAVPTRPATQLRVGKADRTSRPNAGTTAAFAHPTLAAT